MRCVEIAHFKGCQKRLIAQITIMTEDKKRWSLLPGVVLYNELHGYNSCHSRQANRMVALILLSICSFFC